MNIQFIAPDRAQAELAARDRLRFPINFGDCFAYALAKTQNVPLLTLDRPYARTQVATHQLNYPIQAPRNAGQDSDGGWVDR